MPRADFDLSQATLKTSSSAARKLFRTQLPQIFGLNVCSRLATKLSTALAVLNVESKVARKLIMKPQTQSPLSVAQYALYSPNPRPPATPRSRAKAEERTPLDYLRMLRKRWKLITLLSLILLSIATAIIMMLPASYRADVMVVLQPPTVKTGQTIVPMDMTQKLNALKEQVQSRRTLNEVIRKFDLYSASKGVIPADDIFDRVNKSITLKLAKSSFQLFYDHEDPQVAADVANELARSYIEENARMKRETLQTTSLFIGNELKRLEKEVKDVEEVLQNFRKQHAGLMPEDLPANQALLTSLTAQVAQVDANLEGERLRKRKTEEHITDLIGAELSMRQKNIKTINDLLKQYMILEQGTGPQQAQPEKRSENAINVAHKSEVRSKELKDKLEELETQLNRARSSFGTNSPEVTKLKDQKNSAREELDKLSSAAKGQVPDFVASATLPEALDNPEVEQSREQLHIRELALKDASRNLRDLEDMLARGLASKIVVEKAQVEMERREVEIRMFRNNITRTRARYSDELKDNETQLAMIKSFQNSWDDMLVKIQEIEAQRLRLSSNALPTVLKDINTRLDTLNTELVELRNKLGIDFKAPLKDRGELARYLTEHENVMVNLTRQQNEVQKMKERIADIDLRLTNAARITIEYPEIQRRWRTAVDQYEVMLKHKNSHEIERQIDERAEGERMTIWDPAIRTSTPYRPKYLLLFGGALAFSIGAAASLALLLEMLSPKFINADSLHNITGLEVLGTVDQLRKRDTAPLPPGTPPGLSAVVPLFSPKHRVSKQLQDAACLLFKTDSKWPRVIAVCSPGQGDGKTFVASNLAAALAISSSDPIFLVDANMRSPELHSLFGKPLQNGLAEVLEGAPVNAHTVPSLVPSNLQLVTAGHAERHGAVLLGSPRFREMMDKLTYEGSKPRIVLDTPALQSGADVDVLMDTVDGILLVVRRGHTTIADLNRVLRRIPHEKLLGLIFNGNVAD